MNAAPERIRATLLLHSHFMTVTDHFSMKEPWAEEFA